MGHVCEGMAPSLITKKSGDRIKTDRHDALQLARLYRAGELAPVWVPDREQEAMRDWCYRFPARKTAHLQRRAEKTSETVQATAWKAQQRLYGRYRHLANAGKLAVQVNTAIAREMAGFIWVIAREVMPRIAA